MVVIGEIVLTLAGAVAALLLVLTVSSVCCRSSYESGRLPPVGAIGVECGDVAQAARAEVLACASLPKCESSPYDAP
jgi:hypothetical protein